MLNHPLVHPLRSFGGAWGLKIHRLLEKAETIFAQLDSMPDLEYLNGYLLLLAEKHNVRVPYNRAIYRLCKEGFQKKDFVPLDVKVVWEEVRQSLSS